MGYRWPTDTIFTQRLLTVEQQLCDLCQRRLHVCDHRFHRIHTLHGPVQIVCKLAHCPNPHCPAAHRTLSPLAETQLTLPHWTIGWDVFCWLGQRRFARHWSIPQLRLELRDTYQIALSDDALADYVRHYQLMVAARQQDATRLAEAYRDLDDVILTIDGLQPEKGHETLYVVRELRAKRVWFAEALLSSTTTEIQRLVAKAKQWAEQLGKPVVLWMSDKQEAFLKAIAAEFPGVPHRYCQNHFVRDVAKPVLQADSHAKVTMRKKVRGLRAIERDLLAQQRAPADVASAAGVEPAAGVAPAAVVEPPTRRSGQAEQVALDYCAAVRGILNDDHGGPLQPPGLHMAQALSEVRDSIQRNLDAKKGGTRRSPCSGSPAVSTAACKA
jgi:MULE transposase domain